MLAAVQLDFPSVLQLGAIQLPLRAAALAGVVGLALLWFARRLHATAPAIPTGDIAFVVLAAVPGAIVGGRLLHGLAFAAAYALEPVTLLDLGRGSLSLTGAIVGGALTGGWMCGRLGHPARSWADSAAIPMLLAIGGGKLAMLLGGAGQGLPWGGRGGIAFLGSGPWAATDASVPAYPVQLLEGAWALLGIPVLVLVERHLARHVARGRPSQAAGLIALGAAAWWLMGRAAVAVWWRDEPVLGPWGMEGMVTLVLLGATIALIVGGIRRSSESDQGPYPTASGTA